MGLIKPLDKQHTLPAFEGRARRPLRECFYQA